MAAALGYGAIDLLGGAALRGAARVAMPVATQVASQVATQAAMQAEIFAQQQTIQVAQSWWWPWSYGSLSEHQHYTGLVYLALLCLLWLLSLGVAVCFAGTCGCCLGIWINPLVTTIFKSFKARFQAMLPPNLQQHQRFASLEVTARFLETGGEEAIAHVAREMAVPAEQVRAWYARWQIALAGPRH